MKNIRHHTIIITGNDKSKLQLLRKRIVQLMLDKLEAKKGDQLISPIVDSLINNFCSFFIAPDGSKEGYDASDDVDRIRKFVIDIINAENAQSDGEMFRYVELYYGDDNGDAKILNHN